MYEPSDVHGVSQFTPSPNPHKVFLSFFLKDKTSAPDVFSSCSLIPNADFETSLMMVSCYGYEI